MRASGNLGHDAAKGRVFRILRGDALRDDAPLAVDQCDCGFVAGAFDTQDQRATLHGRYFRRIIHRPILAARLIIVSGWIDKTAPIFRSVMLNA